jgi:hypothetical protein
MPKEKTRTKITKKPEKKTSGHSDVKHKDSDGKIPYLETSIDKFYRLVKERKDINFYDAATEYGVTKDQIASWARILEDHKLVKVHYPVFGSPVIFSIEEKGNQKKGGEEEKEENQKKPRKNAPKIIIPLIGGLMIFFGYVMLVSNPFTITMRSQLTLTAERFKTLFGFLPYPLNIITPVIIIIAALWLILGLRHRRKSSNETKPPKEKRSKEKQPKDIESKISKIKEELGS